MAKQEKKQIDARGASRRKFLGKAAGATAAIAAAGAGLPSVFGQENQDVEELVQEARRSLGTRTRRLSGTAPGDGNAVSPVARQVQSFGTGLNAILTHAVAPLQPQNLNTDANFADHGGVFTKCLVHDNFGRVDTTSYNSFINAVTTGTQAGFEAIILGSGGRTLNGPQGGLRYQLEGLDTAVFATPAAAALGTAEYATEMVEIYWASLLRDVNFNDYATNATAIAAAAELNGLPRYAGPRNGSGQVTTNELFRGGFGISPAYFPAGNSNYFPGELVGPYLSQFAILPTMWGAQPINQMWQVFLPANGGGADYMTDAPASGFAGSNWLNVQNGAEPSALPQLAFDPVNRFPRNGRDWNSNTHTDVPPQEPYVALLVLLGIGAPLNPGSPYATLKADNGFDSFGGPDFGSLVGQVAARALDVVWYQKWQVSRRIRPEVGGAFAHLAATGQGANTDVPTDPTLLNSQAFAQSFSKYGTYLLSQAFPEGSPSHPSYPTGHGTFVGACLTVLKFFFDGNFVIPNPMMTDSTGTVLQPFIGPPLTVNGELNKLGHNVSFGHGIHAGIHYRSDTDQSLLLGEAFALSLLQDIALLYNERFTVNIQKFDGTTATISNNGGKPTEIG